MEKIVLANFKQNPQQLQQAARYFVQFKKNIKQLKSVYVMFAVPDVFLYPLAQEFRSKRILFGTQEISASEAPSSVVGQTSAMQAKSCKASFAIVSHPSCCFEPEQIKQKILHCLEAEIAPVVIFGEEKRDGQGSHFIQIKKQLQSILKGIKKPLAKNIVFVYEPVWVSTVKKDFISAYGLQAFETSILYSKKTIAKILGLKLEEVFLLYAGGIKLENVENYLESNYLDGVGVGSASLNPKEFAQIVKLWNSSK